MLACVYSKPILVDGPLAPGCMNVISVLVSLVAVSHVITLTIIYSVARSGKLPARLLGSKTLFPIVKDCALSPPLPIMHNY